MKYILYIGILTSLLACQEISKREVTHWKKVNERLQTTRKILLSDFTQAYNYSPNTAPKDSVYHREIYQLTEATYKHLEVFKNKLIVASDFEGSSPSLLYRDAAIYKDFQRHCKPIQQRLHSLPTFTQSTFKGSCLSADLAYISHLQNSIIRAATEGFIASSGRWPPQHLFFDIPKRIFVGDTIRARLHLYETAPEPALVIIGKDTLPLQNGLLQLPPPNKSVGKHVLPGYYIPIVGQQPKFDDPFYFLLGYTIVER
ncbi:MAG: hypothetical protein ACFB0B_04185 [Thermonemataceae bacterium]